MTVLAKIDKLFDGSDAKIRAFATVTIDGAFAVHGVRVIEGEKGIFASMPSQAYTSRKGEKRYSEMFHLVTAQARDLIQQAVVSAYENALTQMQEPEPEAEQQAFG